MKTHENLEDLMKVLLVTSEVTYLPTNYSAVLKGIYEENREFVAGCVLLKNTDFSVLKAAVGLPLLGATKTGTQLLYNFFDEAINRRKLKFIKENKIPYLHKASMNDAEVIQFVKNLEIDLILNFRTRCIYKKEILTAPKLGCLNVHHGLLPDYRGTLCDLYALSEERSAGFSIHEMVEKVDAGLIYGVYEVAKNEKNYQNYLSLTMQKEIEAITILLKKISTEGKLPNGKKNESDQKTYTRNPTRKIIQEMKKKGMIL